MRKFILSLLALAPMVMYAQDNTWERPEEEQQEKVVKQKENPDAKYLRGAVPEVDGKVVFCSGLRHPAYLHTKDDEGKEPVGEHAVH